MLTSLEVPPHSTDPYLWTDFVELRAMIHPDQCFSRGDLASLSNRVKISAADRGFKHEERWRDIASFAAARKIEFGDAIYPFAVSDDIDTLEYKPNGSAAQAEYILFLFASLLRHIESIKARNALAAVFEQTCAGVFSKLVPAGSEVHATGVGRAVRYKGRLIQKMRAVAKDIRAVCVFEERDFKKNDNGDGGIDLVAWHPMEDKRKGIPAALAQCGCSKEDWKFKQLEPSYARLQHKMPIMHPWSCFYFLPLDFRHPDGGWANESDLGGAIIVDRLRLLRLRAADGAAAPKWAYLQEALDFRYA